MFRFRSVPYLKSRRTPIHPLAVPSSTFEKEISSGREVRATLSLTLFVLSQWVLPQASLLQSAKGRPLGMASAEAAPVKASTKLPLAKAARNQANKASDATPSANTLMASAPEPAWFRASRLQESRRAALMQKHNRLRLAQNTENRLLTSGTGFPGVIIERVNGAKEKAKAVSGPPLIEGVFPTELRPSAPLPPSTPVSHFFLDLENDRVPTQAEIVAQGGMGGPLAPITPAEAEVYAAEVDKELRGAGFEQGLNTSFPTPEEALVSGLPGVVEAAKKFDEAKKKVKKARDQNREFARSMQKWNHNQFKEAAREFETYFEKYPQSPWTPEAMIHVANYAKYTGRSNDSEDLYRRVIEMTSNDPAEMSYNAHRKAFGRLTDLYLIEQRYTEVRPMLEDLLFNDTNWSRRTWGRYWLTQINSLANDPKRLLAERDCGTQALAALLAQADHPHQARAVEALKPTDPRGFSLADLSDISSKQGVSLVGFEGTPTQLTGLPLPLLLHYGQGLGQGKIKIGRIASVKKAPPRTGRFPRTELPQTGGANSSEHFVLVRSYNARRDAWNVLNAQDGVSATLTSAQLARQWSGRGLMLARPPKKRADKSPIPSFASGVIRNVSLASVKKPGFQNPASALQPASSLKLLSVPEMRTTYGTGYAVMGQTHIGDDPSNLRFLGSGGTSCGSPTLSVNPINQNIHIKDTPVWYSPSKGPDVLVTTSYNSLDASSYNRGILGKKWSLNYGSHVVELPGRATIFMPDGSQLSFTCPIYEPQVSGNAVSKPPANYIYDSPRGVLSTLVKNNGTGQLTLTTPEGEQMVYSGMPLDTFGYYTTQETVGFLNQQIDQWGQALTIGRQSVAGKSVPVSITDADGKVTTLKYDSLARLVYAQTPDERQASFSYDASGNLIQCVDVAGQAFQYSYNSDVIVTQVNTVQGSWDITPSTNANTTANADGVFRNYKTTVSNPNQNVRVVAFEVGNPDQPYHNPGHYFSTDYRGNATDYGVTALNDNGTFYTSRVSSVRDSSGLETSYGYGNDQILSPTSTAIPGLSTVATFNSSGRPTNIVQTATSSGASRNVDISYYTTTQSFPNWVIARYLDVAQVVVSGKTSPGATPLSKTVFQGSNYSYHSPGTVIDAQNHRTDFTYQRGEPLTVKTYEGTVTHTTANTYGTSGNEINHVTGVSYDGVPMASYLYDKSGRVRSATDVPTGLITRYLYNNLDAPVATLYPDNTKELIDYTCCTLPGMVTDRSGKKTYYDYDNLKRLIRMQDAEGQTLQMEYDVDGNQTGLLDAKGQSTRWSYNESGRTVSKRMHDGTIETTEAAVQGWIAASTNGRGFTTTYTHNEFGDLTGIDTPNTVAYLGNPNFSSDVTFGYDALGRSTSMNDGVGPTSWVYNTTNQLEQEDGPFADDALTYGYDSLDRLYTVFVARPGTAPDSRYFSYDALSRLSSVGANVHGNGIGTWNFIYRGTSGDLDRIDQPNGTQRQFTYETSPLKRSIGVQNKTNGGVNQSSFVSGFNYASFKDSYSHSTRTYGAETPQTLTYGYSATSMLKSELSNVNVGTASDAPVKNRYEFDPMGNRTQSKNFVDLANIRQVDSSYNGLNQLTGQRFSNITSGGTTLESTTGYGYDGDGNQNTQTRYNAGGGVTGQTQYAYDDMSRLVRVEVAGQSRSEFVYDGLSRLRISRSYIWNGGTWVAQEEKRRVYDGMDIVQERDSNNAVSAVVTRAGNIGGVLARSNDATMYFAYDLQGNVTTLTDALGNVAGSYAYDAFGNTVSMTGVRAVQNPYRFSTKEEMAGLYSFGYRFYNPGTGRWLNRDPIRESGGLNLYGFVNNNPINRIDPYGQNPLALIGAGGGAILGIGGQALSDVLSGKGPSSWQTYTGAAAGGAVTGFLTVSTGNPVMAGVAGGAAGNLVEQGLLNLTGEEKGFNTVDFAADTAFGMASASSRIPLFKIAGINKGRNSFQAIERQIQTKLDRGIISGFKPRTGFKIGVAQGTRGASGAGASSFLDAGKNRVEDLIDGFNGTTPASCLFPG